MKVLVERADSLMEGKRAAAVVLPPPPLMEGKRAAAVVIPPPPPPPLMEGKRTAALVIPPPLGGRELEVSHRAKRPSQVLAQLLGLRQRLEVVG